MLLIKHAWFVVLLSTLITGCNSTQPPDADAGADASRSPADTVRMTAEDLPLSALPEPVSFRAALPPLDSRIEIRGMYTYIPAGGVIQDCYSGRSIPVATEGDHLALENAYLKMRSKPGDPLLISVQGRLVQRPAVESGELQPTLMVERFKGLWHGQSCQPGQANLPLEDTTWMLTLLDDQPVITREGIRPQVLRLNRKEQRMEGFTGCNRLVGQYRLDGELLMLGQLATTRMACNSTASKEQALLKMLGSVSRWRIQANDLDLLDADGDRLARFVRIPADQP